jgi:hypothetical protein
LTIQGIDASSAFDSESVLEAERLGIPLGSLFQDRVPEVLAVRAREVDLIAELANEPDAKRQGGHAGHVVRLRVEVLEGVVRDIEVGEALHQPA